MSTIQIIVLVFAVLTTTTTGYFAYHFYRYRIALQALLSDNVTASGVKHLQKIIREIISDLSSYKDKGTRKVTLEIEINSDDAKVKMRLTKSPNKQYIRL